MSNRVNDVIGFESIRPETSSNVEAIGIIVDTESCAKGLIHKVSYVVDSKETFQRVWNSQILINYSNLERQLDELQI